VRGLIGAQFLDAQRAPRPKGRGFSKHVDITKYPFKKSSGKVSEFISNTYLLHLSRKLSNQYF